MRILCLYFLSFRRITAHFSNNMHWIQAIQSIEHHQAHNIMATNTPNINIKSNNCAWFHLNTTHSALVFNTYTEKHIYLFIYSGFFFFGLKICFGNIFSNSTVILCCFFFYFWQRQRSFLLLRETQKNAIKNVVWLFSHPFFMVKHAFFVFYHYCLFIFIR